jgi:hypothetical protein
MNAESVIRLIEQLSPDERDRVIAWTRENDPSNASPQPKPNSGSAADPAFQAAADQVFQRHRKLFELLAK